MFVIAWLYMNIEKVCRYQRGNGKWRAHSVLENMTQNHKSTHFLLSAKGKDYLK